MSDSSPSILPGVHSINHFVLSVPDLDEAAHFYTAFGLRVERRDGQIDLYCVGSPHRWGSVHAGAGHKKLQYVSLGIAAEDVAEMAGRIARNGLATEPHPLSDGAGLWLCGPGDMVFQLLVSPKVSPDSKPAAVPRQAAPAGRGEAPSRRQVAQVHPRRLSHLLFFCSDVALMIRFAEDILGLRLSDCSGDVVAFLHGCHGSEHHLLAFAKSSGTGLHHSSWDVGNIDEVGCGAEQMRTAGYKAGWGVGRHVLGSNYFYYVRDPWGSYAEYSHDMDFIPRGTVWRGADNPPEDSLYVWGPDVPAEFFINHEHKTA
ncbi:VOC family protein [Herbaspirillum chlorophenolicum]|uniref:VOC family protein n=1 Tax=Herbaspirillum chlorophenolicum TaxID=211589 RepID=A0ABW8EWD8_9BURK